MMHKNLHGDKLLSELLKKGRESEWVEFKLNDCNREEIGEYCSALSNSASLHDKTHGYLIFGVSDPALKVLGTTFKPSQAKVGNEELENWIATQLDPRIDFLFIEFEYENKPVVILRIDAARARPVAFRGKEFIRVGTYKKPLKDHPEKERKLWEKISATSFESRVAKELLDSDEVLRLLDYPKYFELTGQNLPSNKDGIIRKLSEESLIGHAPDGSYFISNLGAILFAKSLKDFSSLQRKAVRVIVYKGKDRLHALKEQEGDQGYASGFSALVSYVNDQLPSNEEIGQALRKEEKLYPEIAIRELIANMVIHQDFEITGTGPMVEIFEDRIEISNPGRPLIDTLRFIDHNPRSRNEKLAYFMRRIKVCEERGTGIDKVIGAVEMSQLPAPSFITEETFFKVTLYAPRSLRQMNRDDKVRACYQHCCLKHVSNSVMTNETLRNRFQIEEKNYSIASRIIADTIDSKLILPSDPNNKSRKMASYIPFWA